VTHETEMKKIQVAHTRATSKLAEKLKAEHSKTKSQYETEVNNLKLEHENQTKQLRLQYENQTADVRKEMEDRIGELTSKLNASELLQEEIQEAHKRKVSELQESLRKEKQNNNTTIHELEERYRSQLELHDRQQAELLHAEHSAHEEEETQYKLKLEETEGRFCHELDLIKKAQYGGAEVYEYVQESRASHATRLCPRRAAA